MARDLRYGIGFDVDGTSDIRAAADDLDELAAAVEEADGTKVEIGIDADADTATRNVESFIADLDGLSDETKTVVLAMEAADVTRQLEDIALTVRELAGTDVDITAHIQGASQLEGDLARLEGEIKSINSTEISPRVDTSGFDRARGGVDGISDSARGANSALANMIGNTAQDLGALGGAAGSAGVAIGQMAEYAADARLGGEALGKSLFSMAKVAGPIAGVAIATQGVANVLSEIGEIDSFNEDQIESFTAAIRESGDASEALRSSLAENIEEVEVLASVGSGLLQGPQKLIDILTEANITLPTFIELVEGGQQALDAYQQAANEAGTSEETIQSVLSAATSVRENHTKANKQATRINEILGTSTEEVADKVQTLADAEAVATAVGEGLVAMLDEQVAGLDAERSALEENIAALEGRIDAQRKAADGAFALRDAEDELLAARSDLAAAEKTAREDGKITAKEYRGLGQALDDTVLAAVSLSDAQVQLAQDQATARGASVSSTQAINIQNQSLIAQAAQLEGPQRAAIVDYIANLNGIPPKKESEILALLDQGRVDEAEELLNDTSRTRDASIEAEADRGKLSETERLIDELARLRAAIVTAVADTGGAEGELNDTARDRYSTIYLDVVRRFADYVLNPFGASSRSTSVSFPSEPAEPGAMRALAAGPVATTVAPVARVDPVEAQPVNIYVHQHAAVIGSPFEVERAVASATSRAIRLAGRRQVFVGAAGR